MCWTINPSLSTSLHIHPNSRVHACYSTTRHFNGAWLRPCSTQQFTYPFTNSLSTVTHSWSPSRVCGIQMTAFACNSHITATSMKPAPTPSNVRPRDAKKYKDMVIEHEVTAGETFTACSASEALQVLFPKQFKTATAAKKACRRGLVLIENEAAVTSTLMRPGQTLLLLTRVQAATQPSTPAQGSSLTIAYEDEHFAAVVKPQGMLTVRMGTSRPGLVLSSCIKHTLTMPRIPGVLRRPEAAHRLDVETGGLVLCGKTTAALQGLSSAFASQRILKRYRALIRGNLQGCGRITLPISGVASETEYRSVAVKPSNKYVHVTVVDLWPRTGRTHQLRKHMAFFGHPILGDKKYWGARKVLDMSTSEHVTKLKESELAASSELEAAVLRGTGGGPGPAASSLCAPVSGAPEKGLNSESIRDRSTDAVEPSVHQAAQGPKDMYEEQVPVTDACELLTETPDTLHKPTGDTAATADRMCLWKVECKLLHPVYGASRDAVHIQIDNVPELFTAALQEHASGSEPVY